MRRILKATLIGLIFFAVAGSGAQFANVAAIFQLGTGGRPLGMGGAFLALADDETAAFYNPAGLGWLDRIGVTSLFAREFEVVSYGALGFALPYFGITLMQIDSGWISTGEEEGFRYVSQAGILSSGLRIGPVGLGGRWKLYRVREPYSAVGWAFDPALLVVTDFVRVGLLFENPYSRPIAFEDGHTEEWEAGLRLGAAVTLKPSDRVRWNAVFETCGLFLTDTRMAGGVEAWIGGLAARVGHDGSRATFGLTVRFDNFQVDWAYAALTELAASHRVSLTFRF